MREGLSVQRGQGASELGPAMRCGIYQPRTYRHWCRRAGLTGYRVCVGESDLFILADHDVTEKAHQRLIAVRQDLYRYIEHYPGFGDSLEPVSVGGNAPYMVQRMADAATEAGVGPMASVAGAISEEIACHLVSPGHDIVVENGGDVYAFSAMPLTTALFAGASAFSMRIGVRMEDCKDGIAVCTSSGSVGHSLSYGNADAVTVMARRGAVADAAATALGNIVQTASDIEHAFEQGFRIKGVLGIVIIIGQHIGIRGESIELCCIQ